MIASDQASIFPSKFFIATSSLGDGTIRHPDLDASASHNIVSWCKALHIPLGQTVGLYITYDDAQTYTDIVTVDRTIDEEGVTTPRGWLKADALITNTPGIGLMLPVADCNAVVYVDPVHNVLALLHLGWHATVNNLASKMIDHMSRHYNSQPEDILIYNSPSIRVPSYSFTHLSATSDQRWHQPPYATLRPDGTYAIDLVKYNQDQWQMAGILAKNIEICSVNTATSDNYPSHHMGQNGRLAVFAMINDRS